QRELLPPERHRMRADREARARVVGEEPLGDGHGAQRTVRWWMIDLRGPSILDRGFRILRPSTADLCLEQLARRPYRLLDLPQRRAAIEAERIQRADRRERRDFVAPERAAPDQLIE